MRARFSAVFGLFFAIAGAATPTAAAMVTLSGEVTYRERVALPAGAVLRVMLVDLTEAGWPARVDVRAPIGGPGQVPLAFSLNFDDLALVREHEHGLVTEILAGEAPWFRNEVPYRLDPIAPAGPVVVITAPARNETAAPEPTTDVAETGGMRGVTWRATEIGGVGVAADVDSTLSIGPDNRVGGRGGCNSYYAQASITGTRIALSAIAATRAACVSDIANGQERAFFHALGSVRGWRIDSDGSLLLLDEEDKELVRLVESAL